MSILVGNMFRPEIRNLNFLSPSPEPCPDDLCFDRMAKGALNYLRGNPDPARSYECKFALGPLGIPYHVPISPPNAAAFDVVSLGDTDSRMDWQYSHMRQILGESEPDPVELGVRNRILSYQRQDHYSWTNPGAAIGETIEGEWIMNWTTAKLLYSLSETFARTGDPRWKREAREIMLALKKLALWEGERAYYWGVAPCREGQWLLRGWCASHGRNYPFIVEPCVRYYECTGDEEGLALAKAFADGFLDEVQPEMGNQRINPETGAYEGHVHLHTHAVWGVAHLGAVLNERRYLDWAKKIHDFTLAGGTDFGWYPEFIPQGDYRTEICVVGDMISLGACLARGAWPEYWDRVALTVRNELRRSQFFLTPAFVDLYEKLHAELPANQVKQGLEELRKIEGGYVAQAAFNDWVSYPGNPRLGSPGLYQNGIHMMGCCSPEGFRGLWEAWNGIVEERPDGVYVNLAMTREHPAADVQASRPRDGRLNVMAKKAGTFFLRPPSWSDRGDWKLMRDGREQPLTWGGPRQAYVVCRDVRPGQKLTLSWPVPEFTQEFLATSIPGRAEKIKVRWIGDEVVDVEPRGQWLPMFGNK
jgi:hypothetical protein